MSLADARVVLAAEVAGTAARLAYMTAFDAARALLFERNGSVPRTHGGVHGAFGRLAKDDPRLGRAAARFLSAAYDLKDRADYRVDRIVSLAEAETAIAEAGRFLAAIERVLGEGPPPG